MKNLFYSVAAMDEAARSRYCLSEVLMMEHAAQGLKNELTRRFVAGSSVLIVVGRGNNGADGYVLARLLYGYNVTVFEADEPKSPLCILQKTRATRCGIKIVNTIDDDYTVVVDAIFGSGLSKPLDEKTSLLISQLNSTKAYKIACDIPSGLFSDGNGETVFAADLTVTMGAEKLALHSDFAKEYVGDVIVASLGVNDELYENGFAPDGYLLEKIDLKLPIREKKSAHKGNYGHLGVFVGDKEGAGTLCGLAALSFGCALVTLISKEKKRISPELMQEKKLLQNIKTVCLGSGLGDSLDNTELATLAKEDLKLVIDADMFYKQEILEFLGKPCVLTPHPKEFASLLTLCGMGQFDAAAVQKERFVLAKKFSLAYPSCVLALKGANTIIAQNGELFVCSLGTQALAKGGSGDVLAGLIGSLLAQGYAPLEAAENGVLAHALASQGFKNNYALTPLALIKKIKEL